MLRWTERAVGDLLAIGDYIAADNPSAARSWVEKLRQRAVKASKLPRTRSMATVRRRRHGGHRYNPKGYVSGTPRCTALGPSGVTARLSSNHTYSSNCAGSTAWK